MNKVKLRKLPQLDPTSEMKQMVQNDIPIKKTKKGEDTYQYGIYLRCQILDGILKAAFFLARDLRVECSRPVYELFINGKTGKFLTWDVVHESWRSARLDNLEWPEYIKSTNTYITPEENKEIRQYLNVKSDGVAGILDYQEKVRAKELDQKHRKKTEPWDKMMKQIPPPPKDWIRWVSRHGIHQHFIFYDYVRKGAKSGYCTWCRREVPVSKPKYNANGICKCCGHKIQFKSRGRAGSVFTDEVIVYLLQKCQSGFVVRQFAARAYYSIKDHISPSISCIEERRIMYDKELKETPYYYGRYRHSNYRWIKGEKPEYGFLYYRNYRTKEEMRGSVYKRTIPHLSKGSLRKTGLPQMIQAADLINPREYLNILGKRPYLERLVKAKLNTLAWSVISEAAELEVSNDGDFAKALGIDKGRMRRLRVNGGGYAYLEWLKFEKRKGMNISEPVIQFFLYNGIMPESLKFITGKMAPVRICNYLNMQYKESGRSPVELVSTWHDYMAMAGRLKMDLEQELIYKPKKLIKSHDDLVKILGNKDVTLQASEILEKYPDVDAICQQIKDKYEYRDKEYAVVVPDRTEDIILEGHALGHCLHSSDIYFERIQTRESYILFLRKASEPDRPYYTLEIEPGGTARQKRTVGDKQNADYADAKNFIKKWQMIISRRLTEEDWELAERSARLRGKEIAELRKNNVKIRHGYLAGKSLADVLEADLLEAERCAREDNQTIISMQEGEQELCAAV
ncbi:MAG: PcfJ domain-containing protein [Hungatella sp.]|jgi:DNA-directed RNA polymerase subunit RPC12/RpoP|nr:PcfJ domain-containing protein [Hungatella sp.]